MTTAGEPSKLYAEVTGRGPRLVLVHGFAQTNACWGSVATDLANDHEVICVDAPGHGRSSGRRAGLFAGARLIADRGGLATYVGYSMGGRFALHVALGEPEVVNGLVLIGASAGIDDIEARVARQVADEARARRLEREGLDAFLDGWLAQPLFEGLTEATQFRAERRHNTVAGLAASLRHAGLGSQDPLWANPGDLTIPVLVVAGALDAKFSAEAIRLAQAIGANAEVALVPGAGHAAHLENPDTFLAILRAWLHAHGL
ncbi:MAG: alpha/beta fold hydrolase [Acidimicrobiales bacterium]